MGKVLSNTGEGVVFENDIWANNNALVVKGTVESDVDTAISVNHVNSNNHGRGISVSGDIVVKYGDSGIYVGGNVVSTNTDSGINVNGNIIVQSNNINMRELYGFKVN